VDLNMKASLWLALSCMHRVPRVRYPVRGVYFSKGFLPS
jgi:hypothetical protein